jgi:protein phosphatase 2C
MVAADAEAADGLDRASFRLPAHFFAVYDGHGGAQVADHCRDRLHAALAEDLRAAEDRVRGAGGVEDLASLDSKKQWEKAFVDCFCRIDAEVGGNAAAGAPPMAPDTVGSTAVVAVVCSSHVIVANCGDSGPQGELPPTIDTEYRHSSVITIVHCPVTPEFSS